ncbi:hypothetical protein [Nonomuraea sp. NPDC050540]|uniref:hypothetical protein n=1 Tax=Nonomuraea sp. NPDC050540 TaxID=3364367 RepID=UPI0037B3335E
MRPSDDVLAAFGLAGPARPTDGGRGEGFRAGDAEAVIVADGLLYHGADPALVEQVDGGARMVARALVFRLATSVLLTGAVPREEVERFARATGVVEAAVR